MLGLTHCATTVIVKVVSEDYDQSRARPMGIENLIASVTGKRAVSGA